MGLTVAKANGWHKKGNTNREYDKIGPKIGVVNAGEKKQNKRKQNQKQLTKNSKHLHFVF